MSQRWRARYVITVGALQAGGVASIVMLFLVDTHEDRMSVLAGLFAFGCTLAVDALFNLFITPGDIP